MNTNQTTLLAEAKDAFKSYMDVYFGKRDLSKTTQFFSDGMTAFGTGLDETAHSIEEVIDVYRRDITQASNAIHYDIIDIFASHIEGSVCMVCAIINIKTKILDQELTLNHLRLSVQLYKKNAKWLIAHKHISLPTVEHEGDESYPIKELEERNIILQRLVDKQTADLKDALQKINILASTDKLTGLSNRNILDERLEKELERSALYGNHLSIILLDIDYFKKINDTYGHITGDVFLQEISNIIAKNVRTTDLAGRWGGEEFLIICPETDLNTAYTLAEKLRALIEQYDFSLPERQSISAGVTAYTPGDIIDSMLLRADNALYTSKSNGRNAVTSQL